MCLEPKPITRTIVSETTNIAVHESSILLGAMSRNVSKDGTREHLFRMVDGIELRCGRRVCIPNLDGIEGHWPDDQEDNS